MKSTNTTAIVIGLLLVLGIVWYAASHMKTPEVSPTSDQAQEEMVPEETQPTTSLGVQVSVNEPAPQSFKVNGNDKTADNKVITVPAGTLVTITFGADAGTTYHGGLDFRSDVVSTGTIAPGQSKIVSFTATKSFSFTPFWPSSKIAKPYTIDIVVQ